MNSKLWAPLLALAALVAVALILTSAVGGVPYDNQSDERYYLDFMTQVGQHGPAVFPELFRDWVADEKAWICPPPTRIGFICISAIWSKVFGASYPSLSYLSMAAFLALIVVQYVFAARYFGRERGAWIAMLTAFSPLLMGLSLQALTDGVNTLCMALSIWLFLDLVHHPERVRARVLFTTVFTLAILVKELSVMLAIPFAAFVLLETLWRREPLPLLHFAWMLAAPPIACAGVYLLAAGDFEVLKRTLTIVLGSPASNKYARMYGSGPWFRYVIDYLLVSPWVTLLAITWLGALLWRVRRGDYPRDAVFFALIPAGLLLAFSMFTKNIRYVAILELPIRIFAVLMIHELLQGKRPRLSTALCTATVLALCWLDWRSFDLFFVQWRIADPMTGVLAVIRNMVPGGR